MKKYSSLILSVMMVCLWGGFYDFTVAVYGVCFGIGLFTIAGTGHKLWIPKNHTTIALLAVTAGFVVSTFAARDKGIGWLGLLRILIFFLFWILWCNFREETKSRFWSGLTDVTAIVTVAAVCCYFIPGVRSYLFHAGRLGGVLQYSNTYAMLLLIALINLFYQKRTAKKWITYVEAGIFAAGIMWCGSRSVFVLSVPVLLILLIRKRKQIQWKWMVVIVLCVAGVVGVSAFLAENDLSRLWKLTLSSSTLNGRILYWRDALLQLVRHPAGVGYNGYYFLQPQFQTGNYTTKFVHNDILQFGLDGGWLAMAGILWMFISGIFSKKNTGKNRLILVFLFLHILFDFDLQYGLMFCIMLMCMDTTVEKKCYLKKTESYGCAAAGVILGGYFAIALGSSYFNNQQLAVTMYPGNTYAWEELMTENTDGEAADRIIEKNGMLSSAYECKAAVQISSGDYEGAKESVEKALERAGYESTCYDQAVFELSYCLQGAIEAGDIQLAQEVLELIQGVPEFLTQKEKQATTLAWRINDSPKIELEESIQTYIDSLKDVSLTGE